MAYDVTTPPMTHDNINSSQGFNLPFGTQAGGIMSQALVTAYNIYPPNNLPELFHRHGQPVSIAMRWENRGFAMPKSTPTTGHYEYDWDWNNFSISSIITPSTGAGTNVVVAVSANDMVDFTINGNPVVGSFPNQWDYVNLAPGVNAQIISKNSTTNPNQLTLRPALAAVDIGPYINTTNLYFVTTNAMAEGTGFPDGILHQVFKYNNNFQIVKAALNVTGSALTNNTVFNPIKGVPGSFYLLEHAEVYKTYEMRKDGAILWGAPSDNISDTPSQLGYSVQVTSTQGFIDFAISYAHQQFYQAGFMVMQDFDEIGDIMVAERVTSEDVDVLEGQQHFKNVENLLYNYIGDTHEEFIFSNVNPASAGYGKEFSISVGFHAVKKLGYNYLMNRLDQLTFVKGAATPGYPYPNWGIYSPMYMMENKSADTAQPTVGWEWKEATRGGYSRRDVTVTLDGAGYKVPSNYEYDVTKINLFCELAQHSTCPNQIVLQQPAS